MSIKGEVEEVGEEVNGFLFSLMIMGINDNMI